MSLETRRWLVWLGVVQPGQDRNTMDGDTEKFKEILGDYTDLQALVEGADSWSDYEQALLDAGFTEDEVAAHLERVQNEYEDWAEYEAFVLDSESYEEYKTGFGNLTGVSSEKTTESGEPVAGIRVHDSPGVSYAGVSLPAGTTEVFGRRIEFSQQDASVDTDDVTWSNMRTDAEDNVTTAFSEIVFSADATNPNGFGVDVTATYQEDGSVVRRKSIRIPANDSVTVDFAVTKRDYICVEAAIGTTAPITACWIPAALIQ